MLVNADFQGDGMAHSSIPESRCSRSKGTT